MNFSSIDYIVIVVYLIGVAVFGIYISGRQKTVSDYFLGSRNIPWWAACFSVVATETSTLTFLSIPGVAYLTNMGFLQLAIGFLIGRIVVAFLFIPKYYAGNLETAYQFLGNRFGYAMRRYSSITFILLRIFADGVRLFTTAIPIKLLTGMSYFETILIVGAITVVYAYIGGIKAVIWTDVIQMFIYFLGAIITIIVIWNLLPNGFADVTAFASQGDKFNVFNFTMPSSFGEFFTGNYNAIGGIIGGAFLAMASHGTDQIIVQRLLTCKDKTASQKALIGSGILVFLQFAMFLLIGVMLFAFYKGVEYTALSVDGHMLTKTDEIFPKFIIESLPVGIAGLVIAGLLAASMSTLSSTFNSLASTTILDLFKFKDKGISPEKELKYSRLATLFWAVVVVGTAMLFLDEKNPAVAYALNIQSIIYGGLLGVFLLGMAWKSARLGDSIVAYSIAILVLILLFILPKFNVFPAVNFTWFTITGVIVVFITAGISISIRKAFK